jgi:uncharacterized cupredoxin-like copper-binding protein
VCLRTPTLRIAARILPCLFACAIAAFGLSACSSHSTSSQGAVVRVTLKDFRIKISRSRVPAGHVRLVVKNRGPDTHELMVARTGAPLPLRADAITVDEEALEPVTVDEVEGEPRGAVHVLRLKLRPGRYELLCNMAGHYLGGMPTPGGELMVRADPAFRPFASRGRRAVAAILATFALFSAVSVGLSIWSTSRSQYKASVLEWQRASGRSRSGT